MTTPVAAGDSGVARNAANWLPSAAVSVSRSCETAAPAITRTGGVESVSKHMDEILGLGQRQLGTDARACALRAVDEQRSVERRHAVAEAWEPAAGEGVR